VELCATATTRVQLPRSTRTRHSPSSKATTQSYPRIGVFGSRHCYAEVALEPRTWLAIDRRAPYSTNLVKKWLHVASLVFLHLALPSLQLFNGRRRTFNSSRNAVRVFLAPRLRLRLFAMPRNAGSSPLRYGLSRDYPLPLRFAELAIQKCRIQRVRIGFSPHTNFVRVTLAEGLLDSGPLDSFGVAPIPPKF
jgi:hypothetical protein